MKNLLVSLVLLFLFPISGSTQSIEYYRSIADTTHNVLLKLEAIDSVLSKSFRKDDDIFIAFSLQYINLAKDIDSIDLAAKKAMNLQHILTSRKNDPRRAITIIDEVLSNKYKIKDSFLLGGLYLKRGSANFKLDLKKAIVDYTMALEIFSEKDSIHVADAYLFRGQVLSNLGKFVSAGEDYKIASAYYENLKDYQYMLFAQQGNITMFSRNGLFEKAKKERVLLINKLIELDLNKYLPIEYYNQAIDYNKTGDKKLELKSLLVAEEILNTNVDYFKEDLSYIIINSKLAEYYSEDFDFEKAEKYLELVEDIIEKNEGDLMAESNYYGAKAIFFKVVEEYENALVFAQKKLESSLKLNFEEDIMDSHLLLSAIYEKTGDYEKSLENKNKYAAIKDSIYNQSTSNSLAYYQTLYEMEKKEKELVKKNSDILLLEKDHESFIKFIFIFSIVLLLLFGLILLYRNQRNLKSKKLLLEKFSQDLIISQEVERKRISKDLHDGLGQKLIIIKNKLLSSGDKKTKTLIDNVIEEVRSISRELHPFQLKDMGITKAIIHTISQIDENTSMHISSEIENIDNLFPIDKEVNIYRIVQECFSNIIKHAKAEASKISIKKMEHKITITIKDNGVGYNFSEKYNDIKSLGLKTLLERTKFLNGQMKVSSKKGEGTLMKFHFPTH